MQEKDGNLSTETETLKKTETGIASLRNRFGAVFTNGNVITNLLNYKFSAVDEFFGFRGFIGTIISSKHSNAVTSLK